MELEIWLAKDFGIAISELVKVLEVLGMGNNLVAEWAKFLKNKIADKIEENQ